nr:hypothetical protein [Tanacetum cinerariifolium]
MSKRLGLGYGYIRKACFVCGSFSHLIRDYDFHEKRMAKQVELNKRKNKDNPHQTLKGKGIIDSGCSRHMTRNKAYLIEYQDFNGGLVAFGDSKGQNTGKDTECLMLSPDFKLPDKNQVLLRIPRQNNIYSFKLENIVPSGDLSCLIAKATVDESNKWHMRMTTHVLLVIKESNIRPPIRPNCNARTPQQNGVVKRKNKTLIEATRTVLADLFLPNTFWVEAVSTACYVLNRPVIAQNKANKTTGPKEANNSAAKNEDLKLNKNIGLKINKEPVDQKDKAFLEELESLKRQEKEADDAAKTLRKTFAQSTKDLLLQAGAARASSINYVNTASTTVNIASTTVNTASITVNTVSLSRNVSATGPFYPDLLTYANQDDSHIPSLEDIYEVPNDRIFTSASYDDEGVVADFTNLESTVNGHRQEEGIDYDEFFAPVARIEAIRIFLAFFSYMGFIVYQMDVKSAFLYGKIDEEVYVSQLLGFIDPKFAKKVYKAVKALYGLHQAPKAWYATLSTFLVQSEYRRGLINKTLFIKKDKKDIMLTASTLIETQKTLVKDAEAADVDVHLYRSMIGSLMYLTASRPDIMYLKGQLKLGLWYPKESAFDLEAYSDSDYAGANLDRKSTTGEVEYVAAASCCGQVLWIQNQMLDYGFNFMNIKIYIDNESIICLVSPKMISLGNEHVSKQGREKAKTRLNIKEDNFNKLDDLVGEGNVYTMNKGRSTDKIKVLNTKAEGVSAAGETLSTATLAEVVLFVMALNIHAL